MRQISRDEDRPRSEMNVLAQPVILHGAHTARLRLRRTGAACGCGAVFQQAGPGTGPQTT